MRKKYVMSLQGRRNIGNGQRGIPRDLSESCCNKISVANTGSKNSNAKLDEETALEIFNTVGGTYKDIGKLFLVSKDAVANIKLGITWSQTTGRYHFRKKRRKYQ